MSKKTKIGLVQLKISNNINKNIESLNISNSAAIVFHHINQQK